MAISIPLSSLRMADIIVSTTDAAVSGVIRFGTGTDVSHSMLYTDNGRVIEAIDSGVVERSYHLATNEATLAIALRRRNMTSALRTSVVNNARGFAGLPYDAVGAAGAGISKRRGSALWGGITVTSPALRIAAELAILNNARDSNKDDKFFCSELVARAYQLAGRPLSESVEPTYMNPREVRVSDALIYVGHLIGG